MPIQLKKNLDLSYGEMFQDDVPTSISILVQNDSYEINGMSSNQSKNLTFQNGKEFLVSKTGKYSCDYSISISSSGAATYNLAIKINSTIQNKTHSHARTQGANDQLSISGGGILDLVAGDLVSLVVANSSNTNDVVIHHANFRILKIL